MKRIFTTKTATSEVTTTYRSAISFKPRKVSIRDISTGVMKRVHLYNDNGEVIKSMFNGEVVIDRTDNPGPMGQEYFRNDKIECFKIYFPNTVKLQYTIITELDTDNIQVYQEYDISGKCVKSIYKDMVLIGEEV